MCPPPPPPSLLRLSLLWQPCSEADALLIKAQRLRLEAVDALYAAVALPEDRSPEAPITACLARLAASPAKALPTVAALASSNPNP